MVEQNGHDEGGMTEVFDQTDQDGQRPSIGDISIGPQAGGQSAPKALMEMPEDPEDLDTRFLRSDVEMDEVQDMLSLLAEDDFFEDGDIDTRKMVRYYLAAKPAVDGQSRRDYKEAIIGVERRAPLKGRMASRMESGRKAFGGE